MIDWLKMGTKVFCGEEAMSCQGRLEGLCSTMLNKAILPLRLDDPPLFFFFFFFFFSLKGEAGVVASLRIKLMRMGEVGEA